MTKRQPVSDQERALAQVRAVGGRFRRPLTHAEFAGVFAAAEGGAEAGLRALWDVLLSDAEGCDWATAVRDARRFDPFDYAIPLSQAVEILELLKRKRGGLPRSAVGMMWSDTGPGTFTG